MAPFMKGSDSEIINSTDLVSKLSQYNAIDGIYVSFDVDSLFTNVPVDEIFRVLLTDNNQSARDTWTQCEGNS